MDYDSYSVSCDIESSFKDDKIVISAYSDEKSYKNGFGIQISSRMFLKFCGVNSTIDNSDATKPDYYCVVSDNVSDDIKNIDKEGKSYPVLYRFKLETNYAAKTIAEECGASGLTLALFIDPDVDLINYQADNNRGSSCIVRGYDSLFESSSSFYKGSELNERFTTGFSVYQPIIYSAFLIIYAVCLIAFMVIVSSIQEDSLKEISLLRILGMRKHSSFNFVFFERVMEMLIGFLLNCLLFIPIFIYITNIIPYVLLINFAIQFIYSLIIIILYTQKETNKAYKNNYLYGGGII